MAAATEALTAADAFTITLIIRRFLPEIDEEARWESFDVSVYSTDRILDALHKIKWEQDGTLSFRRSCAHGICVDRMPCASTVATALPARP